MNLLLSNKRIISDKSFVLNCINIFTTLFRLSINFQIFFLIFFRHFVHIFITLSKDILKPPLITLSYILFNINN